MPITRLHFTDVGPFEEATFEFDEHVNVLTGPNNSGKSAALAVLGELLVYPFGLPLKLLRSKSPEWELSFSSSDGVESVGGSLPTDTTKLEHVFETIGYTCFVPAQRHGTDYRSSGPTVSQDVELRREEELRQLVRARPHLARGGLEALRVQRINSGSQDTPVLSRQRSMLLPDPFLVDDAAVVQKIVDLDYASYREKRPDMRKIIEKVVSIVSDITDGFPMEFVGVGKDDDGLFPQLNTPDGIIPLSVLSQGTQSIIQWVARLLFGYAEYYDFPPDLEERPGVLIVDELDAHLHPYWQRRIIPALNRHVPNIQVFCSTHSPLMLAGLKAGQVQLLERNVDGRVTVSKSESDIVGWTADEILRGFLGVHSPTDSDTADRVTRLQELRRKTELSDAEVDELERLRQDVGNSLLGNRAEFEVEQIVGELKRAMEGSNH